MNNISFDEFKDIVVERIREFLPEGFDEVSLNIVTKPNDIKLTGLTIRKAGSNIAPNIYLESFYSQIENGDSIGVVLRRIADLRMTQDVENIDIESVLDLESCKEKILPRIYSFELNSNMTECRVYTRIEDFIVLYFVEVKETDNGGMSIPIDKMLLQRWNISIEELHQIAIDNLKGQGTIRTMAELMRDMMYPSILEEMDGDSDMADSMFEEMFSIPEEQTMFVVSNKRGINGASMILDDDFMNQVYESVGKDFYVIFSSIHEIILVPVENMDDVAYMQNMVYEINRTQVSFEDRLSDHVYKYTKEDGLVKAA